MRLELAACLVLLLLSTTNAAWPAFLQGTFGLTSRNDGIDENAKSHSSGVYPGSEVNKAYTWALSEHTKVLRPPLDQWARSLPFVKAYLPGANGYSDILKNKTAVNEHFHLTHLNDGKHIRRQILSLSSSVTHLQYYARAVSASRSWIESGHIHMPYGYVLPLDFSQKLAIDGFLGALRVLVKFLILPLANASLARYDRALKAEMALYTYPSTQEARIAPEYLAFQRIVEFRNAKAEQIVMAKQVIMEEGWMGQYQAIKLNAEVREEGESPSRKSGWSFGRSEL